MEGPTGVNGTARFVPPHQPATLPARVSRTTLKGRWQTREEYFNISVKRGPVYVNIYKELLWTIKKKKVKLCNGKVNTVEAQAIQERK